MVEQSHKSPLQREAATNRVVNSDSAHYCRIWFPDLIRYCVAHAASLGIPDCMRDEDDAR
jgi:hypothetical protein